MSLHEPGLGNGELEMAGRAPQPLAWVLRLKVTFCRSRAAPRLPPEQYVR